MVSHLQEENRKLSSLLAQKQAEKTPDAGIGCHSIINKYYTLCVLNNIYHALLIILLSVIGALLSPEVDMALVQRLRGMVDRLKEQLRQRDREVHSKQTEVESVSVLLSIGIFCKIALFLIVVLYLSTLLINYFFN